MWSRPLTGKGGSSPTWRKAGRTGARWLPRSRCADGATKRPRAAVRRACAAGCLAPKPTGCLPASLSTAAAVRPQADGELLRRLDEEILPWTPEALLDEARRFARVYKPISILPPDQYLSVVLQATEGCTWNKCTFCTFYQDRPFHVKSEDEFQRHIEDVLAFFGRGLLMRKSVFLGDGNALALSQRRLLPLMEMTRAAFPDMPIYSFIDVYTGERKSEADWRALAELGLHRIYIGMETGFDPLLALLNKPGSREELVEFVARLKAAGLQVGLIVMIGVGGVEYRGAHAEATLATLERLPLGQGDLVYLSPFIERPGSEYARLRRAQGLTPMSEDEIEAELSRWARRLRRRRQGGAWLTTFANFST